MKRSTGGLCALLVLAGAGCDGAGQQRLIETYRSADFGSSRSEVSRSSVVLSTSFRLGHAYEITAERVEYVSTPAGDPPPLDERGRLVRPRIEDAERPEPAEGDDPGEARPADLHRLTASLPAHLLGEGDLYYRWVVEYASGDDRVSMRKSDIFRATVAGTGRAGEDERIVP